MREPGVCKTILDPRSTSSHLLVFRYCVSGLHWMPAQKIAFAADACSHPVNTGRLSHPVSGPIYGKLIMNNRLGYM